MLSALRLGNFKAFGPTQRLPIKPITLIFGPNSAGKSSLIHGLALAHEALREGTLDVHRTQIGGASIDLGGFRQYVFRRNPESTVEWSVDFDLAGAKGRLADLLAAASSVRLTVSIGIPLDNVGHPEPGAKPHVRSFQLEADDRMLLQMGRRRDGSFRFDRLDTDHPVMRQVFRAMLELGTTVTSTSEVDEESLSRAVDEVLPTLSAAAGPLLPARVQGLGEREGTAFEVSAMMPVSRGARGADLTEVARFFLPRVLDELLRELNTALKSQLDRLRYLGPLRSFPPRHLAFSEHDDLNWQAGGGYAWDVVRRDKDVRSKVNEWLTSPSRLQTPYELIVRRLIEPSSASHLLEQTFRDYVGGFPNRKKGGVGQDYGSTDEDGGSIPGQTRDIPPDLLAAAGKAAKWIPSLAKAGFASTAYMISHFPARPRPEFEGTHDLSSWDDGMLAKTAVDRLVSSQSIEGIDELVLFDRHTGTVVSHRDVGIGISQVLPILVAAYANRGQVIAIEQPEIHLHPALQAELGDVLIDSALLYGNTVLAETHSEHLLLRIMRRMRETHAGGPPEGLPPVRPEHVSLIYVEPTDKGSIAREMPLNERGELVKAWPGGFFEEGLREMF